MLNAVMRFIQVMLPAERASLPAHVTTQDDALLIKLGAEAFAVVRIKALGGRSVQVDVMHRPECHDRTGTFRDETLPGTRGGWDGRTVIVEEGMGNDA